MTVHVTSRTTYILVTIALLVLTAATVGAAFIDLGLLNDVVALGIAASKAVLVALFFMHARYSSGITRLVIVGGLLFLGILLVGVMDDYVSRNWIRIPGL